MRLGLLQPRFDRPKGDKLPEFDEKTGTLKSRGVELTHLARMLLQAVDLAGPEDY